MCEKNSYALITGASSGIWLEIAHSLAKRGYNIILTARNESKLKTISQDLRSKYNIEVDYFICDLADKQGPKNIFDF